MALLFHISDSRFAWFLNVHRSDVSPDHGRICKITLPDEAAPALRKDGYLSFHAKAVMKSTNVRKHTCVRERHSESRDTETWCSEKHLILRCREYEPGVNTVSG
jgi:hypothetical protein